MLTSFSEGLPVVIMEALALGRPVVAPTITGIPERHLPAPLIPLVERQRPHAATERGHVVPDGLFVEQLERVRMQRERVAVRGGPPARVTDLDAHPAPRQLDGREEPQRPGAGDEDLHASYS